MNLEQLLEKNNVIKYGHFILSSGNHSSVYINKDEIWKYPEISLRIIKQMDKEISKNIKCLDYIVTGPATSGSVWASALAVHILRPFAYCEKQGKNEDMVFRRGFPYLINESNVLIIEDIITTGNSVKKTIDSVSKCGGTPIGVICICNRNEDFDYINDIPIISLQKIPSPSYDPNSCPLCEEGKEFDSIKD